jgi:hypothetical protein
LCEDNPCQMTYEWSSLVSFIGDVGTFSSRTAGHPTILGTGIRVAGNILLPLSLPIEDVWPSCEMISRSRGLEENKCAMLS